MNREDLKGNEFKFIVNSYAVKYFLVDKPNLNKKDKKKYIKYKLDKYREENSIIDYAEFDTYFLLASIELDYLEELLKEIKTYEVSCVSIEPRLNWILRQEKPSSKTLVYIDINSYFTDLIEIGLDGVNYQRLDMGYDRSVNKLIFEIKSLIIDDSRIRLFSDRKMDEFMFYLEDKNCRSFYEG